MAYYSRIMRCIRLAALAVVLPAAAFGQIAHDSTLGPAKSLTGPAFTIPHTDGRTVGNNLFHSFSTFNIKQGESATFTGPPNIANIMARVTGGSRSEINGLLRT